MTRWPVCRNAWKSWYEDGRAIPVWVRCLAPTCAGKAMPESFQLLRPVTYSRCEESFPQRVVSHMQPSVIIIRSKRKLHLLQTSTLSQTARRIARIHAVGFRQLTKPPAVSRACTWMYMTCLSVEPGRYNTCDMGMPYNYKNGQAVTSRITPSFLPVHYPPRLLPPPSLLPLRQLVRPRIKPPTEPDHGHQQPQHPEKPSDPSLLDLILLQPPSRPIPARLPRSRPKPAPRRRFPLSKRIPPQIRMMARTPKLRGNAIPPPRRPARSFAEHVILPGTLRTTLCGRLAVRGRVRVGPCSMRAGGASVMSEVRRVGGVCRARSGGGGKGRAGLEGEVVLPSVHNQFTYHLSA